MLEGYSFRQLVRISRRGIWTIRRIVRYWLNQTFPDLDFDATSLRYLVFDGTYFKRTDCFLLLMDGQSDQAIAYRYRAKESFATTFDLFQEAKRRNVMPVAITTDGNSSVIRAIRTAWPDAIVQRCLVHIQRQGLSWLRQKPKSPAAKELKSLFISISGIKNEIQRNTFFSALLAWERRYGRMVENLPANDKVFGDLQRARSLLHHAWPDMFHYLYDPNIASSTNRIEGYFSTVKGRYNQHRGLSKSNRPKYLFWYIYLKNKQKFTNTLPT